MIYIQFYAGYFKLYPEWIIRRMRMKDFRKLLRLMFADHLNLESNRDMLLNELEHSYNANLIDVKRCSQIMHWLAYYDMD